MKFLVLKTFEMLILKLFEIYSNKNCSNQVLKRHVKLASSLNVKNRFTTKITDTQCLPHWVFFCALFEKLTSKFTLFLPYLFLSSL